MEASAGGVEEVEVTTEGIRTTRTTAPMRRGGARSYIVDGKMTGVFAMVAYPASYRDSGVMTFIADQSGQIYQKDLGPNTEQIASEMAAYDPDAAWQPANKPTVAAQNRERVASRIAHQQAAILSRRQMILCLATRVF